MVFTMRKIGSKKFNEPDKYETTTDEVYVEIWPYSGTYKIKAFSFNIEVPENKVPFLVTLQFMEELLGIKLLFEQDELPDELKED